MKDRKTENGFTLVELLVAVVIAAIVMAAVYTTYASQQRSYLIQEQVAAMQQNLRNSLYYLEQDVRMAGYDPSGGAGAGLMTISALDDFSGEVHFTMDLNGDGDTGDSGEEVTYNLSSGALQKTTSDGVTTTTAPVAEGIDALNFVCLDENGLETTDLSAVRSIQIMVVASTEKPDPNFTDTDSYSNQQGNVLDLQTLVGPQAAHHRRNALCVEVKCRNLGL